MGAIYISLSKFPNICFQVLFAFLLVSAARGIEHHAYYTYEAPAYHQIQAVAPAPSKGAVSYTTFTSHHHSAPKATIVAPVHVAAAPVHHHYAPAMAVAPAAEHAKGATSFASFSSSISHPVAVKAPEVKKVEVAVPVAHYVESKPAAASFSSIHHHAVAEEHKAAPIVQVSHHAAAPIEVAHHEIDYYVSVFPLWNLIISPGYFFYWQAEPKYEYKYGVEDGHTGDKKSQHEQRDGEHTKGQYSLVEPDGTILTVDYSVVGKSGFNAVVHRSGHAVHPQVHHKSH